MFGSRCVFDIQQESDPFKGYTPFERHEQEFKLRMEWHILWLLPFPPPPAPQNLPPPPRKNLWQPFLSLGGDGFPMPQRRAELCCFTFSFTRSSYHSDLFNDLVCELMVHPSFPFILSFLFFLGLHLWHVEVALVEVPG